MTNPLSVGVVGIGFGQQVHVPAFRADGRCTVAALCASSAERARKVADRLGVPRAFGDWRELVSDPGIAVVSVAVPPALQPEVVIAAARAGKHVFCEKPAANDAAGAEEMLRACEEAGVCHGADFMFPEMPAWRRVKGVLESGKLGRLRHAHLTWRTEIYALRHRKDTWKLQRDDGGGTLNSFVSHSLYYLEWLFGPVVHVRARLGPSSAPAEHWVHAWLEFAGGMELTLAVAADAYLGSGHRLEVYGDEGALVLANSGRDHARGFSVLIGMRPDEELRPVPVEDAPADGDARVASVGRLVSRFVDGVLAGKSVTPNLSHALRVQRLIDSVRAADATGRSQVP